MGKVKNINNLEGCVLTIILLLITIVLFVFNEVRFFSLGTDSAGYVDLIRIVAENGTLSSSIFSSFYSIMPLLGVPSDQYCSSPLLSAHRASSFLQWHPYLLSYILAFPVKYFSVAPLDIAALSNAINVTASIALIYWYLKKKGLMTWEALSFIFAITISDYWVGAIVGQFYFDRLFMLPGLILVLFCYEQREGNYYTWLSISFAALLSAILISERTAVLAGVVTFGYWFLLREYRFKNQNITLLVFSVISLIYFILFLKFFQNSVYYDRLDWPNIFHNLSISLIPSGSLFKSTMLWFGIVSPMVILAFVNWRYGLLVVGALLPNLLMSVGGAEKTGFATHYHAGYIPFLVGFAAVGYATLINKARQYSFVTTDWFNKKVLVVMIPLAVIFSCVGVSNFKESLQAYIRIPGAMTAMDSTVTTKQDFLYFVKNIPANEWISSPEWTMPSLFALGKTNLDYMPIGLGTNRYVIVNYSLQSNLPIIPSYLDSLAKDKISTCMQDKLDSDYKIKSEKVISGMRYVIYEKLP